jgi:iron complex transport system ATP-binding protein
VERLAELAVLSALLKLEGVSASLGGRRVLEDIGFEVGPGEVVGVLGPNGAGKTSLLRAALGLLRLDAGTARLGGFEVISLNPPQRAARVGYLPQERRLAWNLQASKVVSLGALSEPPARAREIALEMLGRVGLAPLADRGVFDISGGERARVLLARLFATRAPLLVADEPAAGLDPDAQLMTMDLLRAEAARGGGVVVTLHDLSLAARSCDRIVVLDQGRVASQGPPSAALSSAVLAEVFGLEGGIIDTPQGAVVAARRMEASA